MDKLKHFLSMLAIVSLPLVPVSASATEILFAHVDNYGNYYDDGNRIRDMLVGAGFNVTTRVLDDAVYTDYDSFDQIFVYDLYAGADNSATQMANYAGIATWYNGLTDQNLILDGRIISSDIAWTNPAETAWVQNYRDQLDDAGGGLFLGTDHAEAFTYGINEITAGIGVEGFSGFYYDPPLEAYVDDQSQFWLAALEPCSFSPTDKCINDNSSTSFVATGDQANGQHLTPIAYHGEVSDAYDLAAVSSTFGSRTFGTCGGEDQPPCKDPVPEPGPIGLLGFGLLALSVRRYRKSQV